MSTGGSSYSVVVKMRIDADTRVALEKIAGDHDRSLSSEIRRALRQYLAAPAEA